MGCGSSKVISDSSEVVTFIEDTRGTAGLLRPSLLTRETHLFESCTLAAFESIGKQRREVVKAKLKYREMDVAAIKTRYPDWSDEMILDLKGQFQTFDINQDGLIDFDELCIILEELGDTTEDDVRKECFDDLDQDGSNAIDFEEYLTLIDSLVHGQIAEDTMWGLCETGTANTNKIKLLSVVQQIEQGVF